MFQRFLIEHQKQYLDCNFDYKFWNLYSIPQLICFQNLSYSFFVLWFVLISILTRYLNHPFNKTLYRYIVWISVQFCIVAFCSYKYTFLFSIIAFPLLLIINWLVLLRDNRILCRVLRSNLTELDLHSNNRVLYHEQVSGYRCYRFFSKVFLASMLLFVISVLALSSIYLLRYPVKNSFCLVNIVYNINYSYNIFNAKNASSLLTVEVIDKITTTCVLIYSISSSLPIICITLIPLIRACVKRYKSRNMCTDITTRIYNLS